MTNALSVVKKKVVPVRRQGGVAWWIGQTTQYYPRRLVFRTVENQVNFKLF